MTTVIILKGKGDDANFIQYKIFFDKQIAEKFCVELNKKNEDERFWEYAGILEEGKEIILGNPHRNSYIKF